ncbi:MAG: DUF2314 domain-containing protein [Flavobacterium sp.]|nr:MAG: DUF2314 domain-containing protein [Flavobacterium sp.]
MGLLSKIFGKKNVAERQGEPDMVYIPNEDERMNWAIEKANLTLWYFEESLKNPQEHQSYFSVKVKIMDGEIGEHIWLTSPHFDAEGNLFGIVGNDPVDVKTVKLDQEIGVNRDFISDWMIIEGGRLVGGYTLRAIRDGIPDAEKEAFDQSIGMYIDEGIDYFKTDNTTPEGAILCLENAYDEQDIDKAVACKDFYTEAKLMLAKMPNLEGDEDMIKQTAEVLELSFIKHANESEWPNFSELKRAFPLREKISDDYWVITEICWYPDGGKSIQKLGTSKTANGWKVVGLVD